MKKSILVMVILGGLFSCKKTSTAPINTCSCNSTTVAGTYKIISVKYKASASGTESDSFTSLPDCMKDDTYELKADGSVATADAGVSCGLPPAPGAAAWSLESNNTILKMSNVDFTIQSFDCTNLVIYEEGVSAPGDRRTTTYVKQ